ncbi:site-specific DNA-methyltransferase, partial [Shewanella vesiculosa]|uniref:site-specific DNA-methyltransferase n=1 Tax=Shewanella vesiculosa TaxID=518738 RepID=UPI002358140A
GEGRNLSNNPETSGRYHTDWLNMMYPRLKLARNLLKDDGVIFISIDEVEVSNLTRICDEIFGEENRLGTIVWKKKTNGNNMGYIPPVHDYFLAYAKVASDSCLLGFPLSDEFIEKTYSNPDNDPRGSWTTSDLSANHVGPYFEITNPETGEKFLPPKGRYWVFGEEDVKKRIADGRIIFGKSGNGRPIQKKFLNERSSMRRKAESWWDAHGMNEDGTSELGKLIAPKVFTHPKPSLTIKNLSNICTQGNDLILDFFAGSGTTAHAVMQLNAEDGGNRKFILVQLPEKTDVMSEAFKAGYKTIAEISKERIRRAGKKILEELEPQNTRNTQKKDEDLLNIGEADPSVSSVSSVVKKLDLGFKVFKLDSTNIKPWEVDFDMTERTLEDFISNIKPDRREEDVLYEILLKYGLDLTLPIDEWIMDNGKLIMKEERHSQLSTLNSQ